jgi:hypothetical protein
VTHLAELQFRPAAASDAEAIANLHADSWRRTYRGTFSDSFLDGDVVADRLATWTERLRERNPRYCTIVAQDQSSLVGFAGAAIRLARTDCAARTAVSDLKRRGPRQNSRSERRKLVTLSSRRGRGIRTTVQG